MEAAEQLIKLCTGLCWHWASQTPDQDPTGSSPWLTGWRKLLCSGLLPPSLPNKLALKEPFLPQSNQRGKSQTSTLHSNLNSLTDLWEHSKFHQNNLHALNRDKCAEESSPSTWQCPMGPTPSGLGSVTALEGAAAVNLTHPKNLDLVLLWTEVFC